MKKRFLGTVEVSSIGMGCMGFSHAEGPQTDIDEAAAIIKEAVNLGYTYFNTGWNYGNINDPHHNEKILGKALSGIRDQVVISSKCGVSFDYDVDPHKPPLIFDFSRENVRKCVEESLERLNTDYIDFYLLARIDPKVSPEEAASTMAELIQEGKILHWGVSEANEEYLRRANAVCPISVIEHSYNIVNRKHENLFNFVEENNIGWIAYTPLMKGLLTNTFEKGTTFEKDDWRSNAINDHNIDITVKLRNYIAELAKAKNATAAQISLAWILNKKPYMVPIPGMKKRERLAENMNACDITFTTLEIENIEKLVKELHKQENH